MIYSATTTAFYVESGVTAVL